MDKSGENEARGVNTTVDDQEIASSNSGAMGGAPKVSTKVAPQKNLEKERIALSKSSGNDIILTGITLDQLCGIEKSYWDKKRGNRGVNTTVDDQEIVSSNSGAMGGAPKVSTKVAPQKKLEKRAGITIDELCGIDKSYWDKKRGNQK